MLHISPAERLMHTPLLAQSVTLKGASVNIMLKRVVHQSGGLRCLFQVLQQWRVAKGNRHSFRVHMILIQGCVSGLLGFAAVVALVVDFPSDEPLCCGVLSFNSVRTLAPGGISNCSWQHVAW